MNTKSTFKEVIVNLHDILLNFEPNVYAVGGCIRDLLMGVEPHDIDIVVDAPNGDILLMDYLKENYPDRIENICSFGKFNTSRFDLIIGENRMQLDVAMTRIESYHSGCRKPDEVGYATVTEDAKRRDFTLNALYYNIRTNDILDPTGKGQEDLSNRILRTPLDPFKTFEEDSLRMLRAVRFETCKGFTIASEVEDAIKEANDSISTTPKERVLVELNKIMESKDAVKGFTRLHELGLLKHFIPELDENWEMDQKSKYHSFTFSGHTFAVLDKVVRKNGRLNVRWAALLHDIAKPFCYQENENGSRSYIGHDVESGKLAESIMRKLKFDLDSIKEIRFLISNHMIIKNDWDMTNRSLKIKDSKVRRTYRILGNLLEDEMLLIDADNNSHNPDFCLRGQVDQFMNRLKNLKIADYSKSLLSGNEINSLLGINPSPATKYLKEVVLSYQDSNPDITKDQAEKELLNGRGIKDDLKKLIEAAKL